MCSTSGQCRSAASIARSGSSANAVRASRCRTDRAAVGDQPKPGMARRRRAARDRDRVVAAEARHVDVGIGHEGRAVAFVAEAPGRAGMAEFETGASELRLSVGEIGHRIERRRWRARCGGWSRPVRWWPHRQVHRPKAGPGQGHERRSRPLQWPKVDATSVPAALRSYSPPVVLRFEFPAGDATAAA